ncbi:MAG: hypothetical protein VYA97_00530, partial [Pseudomonadota bacterium]|nr:hypothetical protein [Pseudomonadota bacterium]
RRADHRDGHRECARGQGLDEGLEGSAASAAHKRFACAGKDATARARQRRLKNRRNNLKIANHLNSLYIFLLLCEDSVNVGDACRVQTARRGVLSPDRDFTSAPFPVSLAT